MKDYLSSSNANPYSHVYMKQKLREYYSDRIVISESRGKSSIVTLRSSVGEILRECHSRSQNLSPEEHKKEILKAVAKLIKSDVKSCSFNTDRETYCKHDDLTADSALESLPESLQYLCSEMFVEKQNERKVAAIGQSIMQCVRPRAIVAPLQIGLAVQMHFHFRSRYLIDVLHSFGFCSSYNELQRFERNAAVCGDDAINAAIKGKSTLIMVADNVGHNICTLNGENTFHGMGMIAAISNGCFSSKVLSRRNVTNDEILKVSVIDIHDYKSLKSHEPNEKFVTLPSL